jgi:solute carrier family 34 (sodium-dependent phosphate cotransporter)
MTPERQSRPRPVYPAAQPMGDLEAVESPRGRSGGFPDQVRQALRLVSVVFFLYLFLVGVKSLETGIGSLGENLVEAVFAAVANPISALAAGILATVLVQSSSVSTAVIVGLVGAGVMSVETAVPMVMGANIGTTVTSTLAALGHIRQSAYFERAFAAATLHDGFNLLAVALFLPLEMAFGVITWCARVLEDLVDGFFPAGGSAGSSVVRDAVAAPVKWIQGVVDGYGWSGGLGPILLVIGLGMIFLGLARITKGMKSLISRRLEGAVNSMLGRGGGWLALLIGAVMTVAVQSSSITTSILVPLVAAGLLTLPNAFPVTVGSNIGTTVTAMIASMASESEEALVIALAHVSFNLLALLAFFVIPVTRRLPLAIARTMARLAMVNKTWVAVYVVGVFIVMPVLLLVLF